MQTRSISRADVVVLAALGMFFTLLVPTVFSQQLERAQEMRSRTICLANLRGIAQSMAVYGADNNDVYPYIPGTSATAYDAALKPEIIKPAIQVGPMSVESAIASIYQEKKYPNHPYAAMWMLVLRGDIAAKSFLCATDPFSNVPALTHAPQEGVADGRAESPDEVRIYLNFQDKKNISYSFAYPWVERDGKIQMYGAWRAMTNASIPIVSDIAPYLGKKAKAGEAATRPAGAAADAPVDDAWAVKFAGSSNHGFVGQNVAFGDGHAEFMRRADIGQNNDSIWGIKKDPGNQNDAETTIEAGALPHALGGSPGGYDIVMVPTRDAKGELK